MKRNYLFLFILSFSLVFSGASFAQIVSNDVFLQGHWLEIGIDSMGAFGTCFSPPGYHAHSGSPSDTACFTPSGQLDACYDWGHDGWGVGTPCEMGDYTIPGYPQEGWTMDVAGGEYRNWAAGTPCAGNFDIPGSITGYSNSGGIITGTFTGNVAGLHVIQESRVDTEASWVVITTRIYNTTASAIPGVYYERTCDPDNTSFWPGGSSSTANVIVHQNEDARHEVEIGTYGTDSLTSDTDAYTGIAYSYNRYDSWMALATKDCRAKCMVLESLYPTDSIFNMWVAEDGTSGITLNIFPDSNSADEGIALIYNLGTIAPLGSPGDSAIISYAYIYDGPNGMDSAFPDPQLRADNVLEPLAPAPFPSYDTFYTCSYPGLTTMPINVLNASDKDWSWSTWTWSPSTGLSSTTGVTNTLNVSALSGPTTYTITGTDSAVNMMSCNYRVFYFTVFPCFSITSNSPGPPSTPGTTICISDTLKLFAHGDSTGATYSWYGPGGWTATGQYPFRTGLILADTGLYYGIKIVGTSRDTVSTRVFLNPLPTVSVGSNGPICSGGTNVLMLTSTPSSVGETFTWTGPNGYSSTAQNPTATGLPVSSTGVYSVVTTLGTCVYNTSLFVTIDSTPALPSISSNAPICSHRDSLIFTSSDATPGVTYSWSGPLGFTSVLQNPDILPDVHVPASGIYSLTVTLSTDGLSCSTPNTLTVVVDSTPYLPIVGSNGPNVCTGTPLLLTATSTASSNYSWSGPDFFTSALQNPTINPAPTVATGTYFVTATLTYPGIPGGCTSDIASIYVAVDSTPVIPTASSNSPGAPGPILCQGDTLKLTATDTTAGVSYSWAGPDVFTSTDENPILIDVSPAATGSYTVTASLGICAANAITSVTITPTPPLTATNNGPVCTGIKDTLLLQAYCAPGATYSWTGPYTFFSLNQNPYRTPVVYEYGGVYQVTAFLYGCPSDVVNDTVVVRQTPEPPIVAWLTYCQFYPASPLQAMGDSILWYPTDTANGIGSLTAPVPSTTDLGVSWFYASQTLMSCTSYIDSIKVAVNPKPTVTVTNDTNICPHDTVVLTATDTDPLAYYHWFPSIYLTDTSSATIVTRPETSVNYTVVAANQFGCTDTAHVTVNVAAAAVLNLGDSVTLYPGQSYQLDPQTNCTSFSWFPPAGLDNAHISSPVASPQISTIYTVEGETSWGCITSASISIYVNSESSLILPNAFTPGSGANSAFTIIKQGDVTLKYFRIFDRWGVKVFETTNIDQGWDGTYSGTPQPFGVYVYELSAITSTGNNIEKHGNVTLIR